MINNNFLNGTASLLAGSTFTIPSHLAFGSTTVTLTETDIYVLDEFDRNSLDSITPTSNVVKYIGSKLAVDTDNDLICQIALVNSSTLSSSNNIQSNFLVSSLTHTTDFDISVEYWFTIDRA